MMQYNLCFVYPPAPASRSTMTQVAVVFLLVGLDMHLVATFSFLCFTKARIDAAVFLLMVTIVANIAGFAICFQYFQHLKEEEEIEARFHCAHAPDWSSFADAYTEPSLKGLQDFISADFQVSNRVRDLSDR